MRRAMFGVVLLFLASSCVWSPERHPRTVRVPRNYPPPDYDYGDYQIRKIMPEAPGIIELPKPEEQVIEVPIGQEESVYKGQDGGMYIHHIVVLTKKGPLRTFYRINQKNLIILPGSTAYITPVRLLPGQIMRYGLNDLSPMGIRFEIVAINPPKPKVP